MSEQMQEILDYLENSYSGAKMMHDDEAMLRIGRAIAAFTADVDKEIFTDEFVNEYTSK